MKDNTGQPRDTTQVPPRVLDMLARDRTSKAAPLHKRAFVFARILAAVNDPCPPWRERAAFVLCKRSEVRDLILMALEVLPMVKVPYGDDALQVAFKKARANPILGTGPGLLDLGILGAAGYYLSQSAEDGIFRLSLEVIRKRFKMKYRSQAKRLFDAAVREGYLVVVAKDWSIERGKSRPLRLGPFFSGLRWHP